MLGLYNGLIGDAQSIALCPARNSLFRILYLKTLRYLYATAGINIKSIMLNLQSRHKSNYYKISILIQVALKIL